MRWNKKIFARNMAILAAIILVIFFGARGIINNFRDLELKGNKDTVVEMGTEFKDEGCNISSADVKGTVDTETPGDYVLTYTYKDQSVKRTVHVVDPASVVVGLKGSSKAIVKQGEKYVESGAYGIDKTTGKAVECKISGDVDTSKPGTYKVKYSFKSGSIEKKLTRKVEVVDKKDFKANKEGVPVLMYHYVYTENDMAENLNGNYILQSDLENQLKYLTEEGYYFPSFSELRAYVDGKLSLPEKSVILTFDDGQYGFLSHGIPSLEKYKVPAISFLIGTKEGESKMKDYASPYVCFESHSYDMHKPGGNIGHGGVISAMNKEGIKEDLTKMASILGTNDAFAYPYGDMTEDAKAAVKDAGIKVAFSTEYGKVHEGADFRALPRVRVQGYNSLDAYIATIE